MVDSKSALTPPAKGGKFSPLTVAVSPASKIGQRGNLTGLPRTVRDSVAELYNLVQKWNKEHAEGCLVLSTLAEIKKANFSNDKRDNNFDSLQPLCDLLESSCNTMDEIVTRMQQLSSELGAVNRLADLQNQDGAPLFLTWPITQFTSTMKDVSDAYSSELCVKRLVLRRVAVSKDETALIFFVAAWVHQSFVSSATVTLKIEAALLETGLR